MKRCILALLIVCCLPPGVFAQSADDTSAADSTATADQSAATADRAAETAIAAKIRSVRPDLQVVSVEPSPIPGVYQAQVLNGPMLYVSADGGYFIVGDLYQIGDKQLVNLTDRQRDARRAKLLAQADPSDMIVFAPDGPSAVKATVTVFTDVDCPWCQRFHQDVPELNKMGIEVRYMAFPRDGIGSPAYKKMVSAWCADDPKAALTRLKNHESIPAKTCDGNPVAKDYLLGQKLDVRGTPSLVFSDGSLWPGYMGPKQLEQRLGIGKQAVDAN